MVPGNEADNIRIRNYPHKLVSFFADFNFHSPASWGNKETTKVLISTLKKGSWKN